MFGYLEQVRTKDKGLPHVSISAIIMIKVNGTKKIIDIYFTV